MEGPHGNAYTIQIDEEQRLAIVAALTSSPPAGRGGEYLLELFDTLGVCHDIDPDTIHSFCR